MDIILSNIIYVRKYIMSFFRTHRSQALRSASCSSENLAICDDFRRIGVNQMTFVKPVTPVPTILSYSYSGGSIILSFTPPPIIESPITSYEYSTNGTTFKTIYPATLINDPDATYGANTVTFFTVDKNYYINTSLGANPSWVLYTYTITPTTSPLYIPGLANNTTFSITIRAVSTNGPGPSSAPISVTTTGKIPASLRFNGTNKLTLSPGVTIGTNAYTVECWFNNMNNWSTQVGLLGCEVNNDRGGLNVFFATSTTIQTERNQGGLEPIYTFASAFKLNTWQHFALVRDSLNRETVFIDGVRATSASNGTGAATGGYQINTGTVAGDANPGYAGRSDEIGKFYSSTGSTGYFKGFLANFRIVVGTAVYDPTQPTCTVPTSALTNIPNTKYLMSGTAVLNDGSSTQTVTNVGAVGLRTFQVPF